MNIFNKNNEHITTTIKPKQYCNNCGNLGHILYQCKMPILSIGVVTIRWNPTISQFQYLMIRRKDTLGYIDFLRGKYTLDNKEYVLRMFKQMTTAEMIRIQTESFESLWKDLWGKSKTNVQYRTEELGSFQKFNQLMTDGGVDKETGVTFSINDLIYESTKCYVWHEQEWGFPKGRRNTQETDYNCAMREMSEETGYTVTCLLNIHNIVPFEEEFVGSNNKQYKHRYYLMFMDYQQSLNGGCFQKDEVSAMEWFTYNECVKNIRVYNTAKRDMTTRIHNTIMNYKLVG